MAKSNKPIVWFPFAAGGTVIAFCIPVIVALTLLAALGHVPAGLGYDKLHAFASSWLGKLVIFAVMALSLWSSAHRLRCTCYDFGLRMDSLVAAVLYLTAIVATVVVSIALVAIKAT
jgi:fumarate reductase subunit D